MRSIVLKAAIVAPVMVLATMAIGMPPASASAVKVVGTLSPLCAVDGTTGPESSGQTVNDGGNPNQCC